MSEISCDGNKRKEVLVATTNLGTDMKSHNYLFNVCPTVVLRQLYPNRSWWYRLWGYAITSRENHEHIYSNWALRKILTCKTPPGELVVTKICVITTWDAEANVGSHINLVQLSTNLSTCQLRSCMLLWPVPQGRVLLSTVTKGFVESAHFYCISYFIMVFDTAAELDYKEMLKFKCFASDDQKQTLWADSTRPLVFLNKTGKIPVTWRYSLWGTLPLLWNVLTFYLGGGKPDTCRLYNQYENKL